MLKTYEQIYQAYAKKLEKDAFINFVLKQDRDKSWLPLIYYIEHTDLNGRADEVYNKYFYWADESGFDMATRNKFTRHANKNNYFYKHRLVDDKLVRFYEKKDYCPSCKRPF